MTYRVVDPAHCYRSHLRFLVTVDLPMQDGTVQITTCARTATVEQAFEELRRLEGVTPEGGSRLIETLRVFEQIGPDTYRPVDPFTVETQEDRPS